jgi:hypothetical protein
VVFVADDLGAWLVGLLADAGRKKLTALVLGGDQERALRKAAVAAVQDTAAEMSSSAEQAGQLAMVISEVFRVPGPDAPLAGSVTMLEGLQAGIAGQLAVLDDVGRTGTGQSSAEVLGVPGAVLAEKLTGCLVRGVLADAGNESAAEQLAGLLAQHSDLDGLRARADADDRFAARSLVGLLADRDDLDGLRVLADAGHGWAGPLADLLIKQGRGEEAERLRRFGLNPDGSIACS